MKLRQHPMGVTSFSISIINLLMTILMRLPLLELIVLALIFGIMGIKGANKHKYRYTSSLAITGTVFSVLLLAFCGLSLTIGVNLDRLSLIVSILNQ